MTSPSRLGLPVESQILMCAGEFIPGDGMKLAIWAFDILKYVAPKLHLVLVGDGPERERMMRFARSLGSDDWRVHFLIDDHPLSAVEQADVVWGTHPRGGVAFLNAALNLGTPALAFRTPDTESASGLTLTPFGDPVALATTTRKILGCVEAPGGKRCSPVPPESV